MNVYHQHLLSMRLKHIGIFLFMAFVVFIFACERDKDLKGGRDLTTVSYQPIPYELEVPDFFPPMPVVENNPLTEAGVLLGRHLFYDPILSRDSTISCAFCHKQNLAFTDGLAKSVGIDGRVSPRSSMSLVNLAWATNGLFWDGRVKTLEEQSLHPIEDPLEMDEKLPNVLTKLMNHPRYPEMIRKAFGISNSNEISKEHIAKALAQFQRIIISGDSKADRDFWHRTDFLSGDELDGFLMLFGEGSGGFEDAECLHCHTHEPPLFTNNSYRHNGIISVAEGATNPGRSLVTGEVNDVGKFRVPTLRNIAVTGPYMHDGRIQTLEEVLDHYFSGGHPHPNRDANLASQAGTNFSPAHKAAMVKALHALTDSTLLINPAYASPFD